MANVRFGLSIAAKEHLASGGVITRLEALIFYGISNLTQLISTLRDQGWIIESRTVPYAVAIKRINKHATLVPPNNLPVREIYLTEYWVSK